MASPPRARTRTRRIAPAPEHSPTTARIREQAAGDGMFDLPAIYPPEEVLPDNLADRARHIGRRDTEYSKEFVLRTLHQLMLTGMPVDQIASRFGVTVRTVVNWRAELRRLYREAGRGLDPVALVGEGFATLRTIREHGFSIAMKPKASASDRRAGLEVALQSQRDMMKLLQACGAFINPMAKAPADASDPREQEANLLRDMTREFLEGAVEDGDFTPPGVDDEIVDDGNAASYSPF